MPQLWIETWVTQYFWLIVILFFFHFYMANKVIPSIATILKIRKNLTSTTSSINTTTEITKEFKILLPTPSNSKAQNSLLRIK